MTLTMASLQRDNRSIHHIQEESSEKFIELIRSRLKTLNRCQLELLVCVLSREIDRLQTRQKCKPSSPGLKRQDPLKMQQRSVMTNGQTFADSHTNRVLRSRTAATGGEPRKTGHFKQGKTLSTVQESKASTEDCLRTSGGKQFNTKRLCTSLQSASCEMHNGLADEECVFEGDTSCPKSVASGFEVNDEIGDAKTEVDRNLVAERDHQDTKVSTLERILSEHGLEVVEDCDRNRLEVLNLASGRVVYQKTDPDLRHEKHKHVEGCADVSDVSCQDVENGPKTQAASVTNNAVAESTKDYSEDHTQEKKLQQQAHILNQASHFNPSHTDQLHALNVISVAKSEVIKCNRTSSKHQCKNTLFKKDQKSVKHTFSSSPVRSKLWTSRRSGVTDKEKFHCVHCKAGFPSKPSLKQHSRAVHKCDAYICSLCDAVFNNKLNLKAHLKNEHSRRSVLCTHCGKLVQQARLRIHMEKVHERPVYTCHICRKGFLKRECLEGHMNKHSNTKPFKCEFCGRKYTYSTSLWSHKRLCSKARVPSHLLQSHGSDEKDTKCICEICGMKFEGSSGLKDHHSAKHSSKIQTCGFCGKEFEWRPSYNRHVKKCKDRTEQDRAKYKRLQIPIETGKVFMCSCGKQYPYRQSYRRHQKTCQHRHLLSHSTTVVSSDAGRDIPFSEYLSSSLELSATLNMQC